MTYRVWQKDGSLDEIENVSYVNFDLNSGFYCFYGQESELLSAFPSSEIKVIGRKPKDIR